MRFPGPSRHYKVLLSRLAPLGLLLFASLTSRPPAFAVESAATHVPATASYQDIEMFAHALTYLQLVSGESNSQKKYLYAALEAMTEAVDRYSHFVPPGYMGMLYETFKDKYVGIGTNLARSRNGTDIEITATVKGSPAEQAGLGAGDVITAIDGKTTKGMRLVGAFKLIRAPELTEGTKITLTIRKSGAKIDTDVALARAWIKPAVTSWSIPEKSFGWIKVFSFNKSTVPDFRKAVDEVLAQTGPLKGLIIDLRNNPGGDVDASVELTRLFLNEGVIASLTNRLSGRTDVYKGNMTRVYAWPIVVLVNKGTASAAEMFSGALQISKRAVLIGQTTYGKGVFQSFVPLTSDSGLYLTLGPYYLAEGKSVDGVGLTPDVPLQENMPETQLIKKALDVLKSLN